MEISYIYMLFARPVQDSGVTAVQHLKTPRNIMLATLANLTIRVHRSRIGNQGKWQRFSIPNSGNGTGWPSCPGRRALATRQSPVLGVHSGSV